MKNQLSATIKSNIPFKKGVPVRVKIGFFMQQPLSDFVDCHAPGNMKPTSLDCKVVPHGADVDNLV